MEDSTPPARIRRAVALIGSSLITIAASGFVWVHPAFPALGTAEIPRSAAPPGNYQVTAVDFIDPTTGWAVANFNSGHYAVLHTTDAGRTWTKQLFVPAGGAHTHYLKFFDAQVGVFALIGSRPMLHRTSDGGQTWTVRPALNQHSSVLSWSFVDSDNGWMLADIGRRASELYRTEDGGRTWKDLGVPVGPPDQAFGLHFTYLTTGWLASAGSGAYAYKTDDFGETWSRVALPAPAAGWPQSGRFFVDVHQTSAGGAIASVVMFSTSHGQAAIGTIRQFPPLPVPFYDGSRPNYWIYTTLINQVVGGPFAAVQAPLDELLSSVDDGTGWATIQPPFVTGAVGYADAFHWWWLGSGKWSSTADAGVTWTGRRDIAAVEPLQGSLEVLDPHHAWFIGSAGQVLESTIDGGTDWRLIALPSLEDRA
jgi:photosystem II stability/assembly factor-like uncharacterized protein